MNYECAVNCANFLEIKKNIFMVSTLADAVQFSLLNVVSSKYIETLARGIRG